MGVRNINIKEYLWVIEVLVGILELGGLCLYRFFFQLKVDFRVYNLYGVFKIDYIV